MKISKKNKLYYKVDQALDNIRPYLKVDGGDIDLIEVTKDKIVKVKFTGSCATCDVSMMTFRNGIETTIKKNVPEIKEVIEIIQTNSK